MNTAPDEKLAADIVDSLKAERRLNLTYAVRANADAEAELQELAKHTGIPIETVRASPEEVRWQAAVERLNIDELAKTSPATTRLLSDPEKAKIVHDDVQNTQAIEAAIAGGGGDFFFESPEVKAREKKRQEDYAIDTAFVKAEAGGQAVRGVINPVTGRGTQTTPKFDPKTNKSPVMTAWEEDTSRTVGSVAQDTGVALLKSAVGLPQAFVGLADIPTFGYAGKAAESVGIRFNDTQALLDELYSPAQQKANSSVAQAKGFLNTTAAMASNPSTIGATVVESLGSVLGGAGIARGVLGLGAKGLRGVGLAGPTAPGALTRAVGAPWGAAIAGATGEGAITAGALAEQIRSQTADGTLSLKQVLSALGGGVGTAGLSLVSAGLSKLIGVADIDSMLASGQMTQETLKLAVTKQLALGGLTEGVEEMSQSAQEQFWSNVALGKPLMQGVKEAAAMGLITGGVMGAGFQGALYAANRSTWRAEAEKAQATSEKMAKMDEAVKASKFRKRDVDSFEAFVAQAAENGPMSDVYVDAKVFMQSGVADQVMEAAPSVRAQVEEALASGGDIRIPVAEYAARVAGTDMHTALADHLRTDPRDMSRAEAEVFMQNEGPALEAEVQDVVARGQRAEERAADTASVVEQVRTQIEATGRHSPAVAKAQAALVGEFYKIAAGKLGTTATELFQQKPLAVVAQRSSRRQFAQQDAAMPAWFGASKVVTEQGEPLVVYHGTKEAADFTMFDPTRTGQGNDQFGSGFYFATNPEAASSYATSDGPSPGVLPVFLSIKNPIVVKGDSLNTSSFKLTKKQVLGVLKSVPSIRDLDSTPLGDFVDVWSAGEVTDAMLADVAARYAGTGKAMALENDFFRGESTAFREALAKATGHDGVEVQLPSGDKFYVAWFPEQIKSATGNTGAFDPNNPNILAQDKQGPRGLYSAEENTITLLETADLSTFLHESGHAFLQMQFDFAAQIEKKQNAGEVLTEGEQSLLDDANGLLKFHFVGSLADWYQLPFEQKEVIHEDFARSFEAYLFEGKAPSIALHPLFQQFAAWLRSVYRKIKQLGVTLTPEVRGFMDRMLATEEEIAVAEQARSLMPMFFSGDAIVGSQEEFAAYQALNNDATQEALQELQARTLRDMAYLKNAKGREVKKIQKQAAGLRREVRIAARADVLSRPVYRAWQFLTNKMNAQDKALVSPVAKRKSSRGEVNPEVDSLFVAIAKLGGLSRKDVARLWGFDTKEKSPMPVFGAPLLRKDGGLSVDAMGEALAERGYLLLDENGKFDTNDFEQAFSTEYSGKPQYSNEVDPTIFAPEAEVSSLDYIGAARLDESALADMDMPEADIAAVRNKGMTAKMGVPPDMVADLFGFRSGYELVAELRDALPPNEEIENLTDLLMLEQYGDLSTPEAIESAAEKAIFNDVRAKFVATEMRMLDKAVGKKSLLTPAAKEFAENIVAKQTVKKLKPAVYSSAEAKAAKAAAKASKAGDLATAAVEKRNQLINIFAARATHKAQEDVIKIVKHFKKVMSKTGQKAMRGEYREQMNALLGRFDFRAKSTADRAPLADWVEGEAARLAAVVPELPEWVLNEGYVKSYKDMTVEELRGLDTAVRQLEHMARREQKMYKAVRDQNYEQEVSSVLGELARFHPEAFVDGAPIPYRKDALPLLKEFGGRLQSKFDGQFLNLEAMLSTISRGEGKALFESLFQRMSDAQDARTAMMKDLSTDIGKATGAYTAKERLEMPFSKTIVPGTKLYMTREQRVSVALFNGSEEGRQRLLGGNGYDTATVQKIVDSLDAKDIALVKSLWQVSEVKLWPELAALNERTVGVAPVKVKATPFRHATLGDLPGGYVPLVYDGDMDARSLNLNEGEAVKDMLGGTRSGAATKRSASKERVAEVNRPLDLSIRAMAFKLNETVHDITHREAVADTVRILQSKPVANAIRTIAGPDVYKSMLYHVNEVAAKPRTPTGFTEKLFWFLRKNTLVSMMGASFNTVAINVLGAIPVMRMVGPARFIKHASRFASPRGAEIYNYVLEKSTYMRERLSSFDRDMNEELNRLRPGSVLPSMGFWFAGLSMMDRAITMPAWLAAYEKGMGKFGNDDAAAVAYADRLIRETQGSGRAVDLAAIAGGVGPAGEFKRIVTMFMNFFISQLGSLRQAGAVASGRMSDGDRIKAAAGLTYAVLAVVVVPATLEALARGNCGEVDDAESLLFCSARSSAMFTAGFFPVFRDVLPYLWKTFDEDFKGGFGVRLSPIVSAMETIARMPKAAVDVANDEDTQADANTLLRGTGYLLGLPGFQAARTMEGYRALVEGESDDWTDLLTGPSKDK